MVQNGQNGPNGSEIIIAGKNGSQGYNFGKFLISLFLKGLTHSALSQQLLGIISTVSMQLRAAHTIQVYKPCQASLF